MKKLTISKCVGIRASKNNPDIIVQTEVMVEDEVYEAYMSLQWKDDRENREQYRCILPAERGEFKRCRGNCSECFKKRNAVPYSIEQGMVDGFDYESDESVENAVVDSIMLESIFDVVDEMEPIDREIFSYLKEEMPIREIGELLGMSHVAVSKRKKKIYEFIKSKLYYSDFE